jgi:16S rRNA (cytosine1402-N4)-methyltransferase
MLAECLEYLALPPGGTVVDATLGLGGHSAAMLERVGPEGTLVGLDQDPGALSRADARLRVRCAELGWTACPIRLVRSNFGRLDEALDGQGIAQADGFLFDLGVSSMQLDLAERGFSFRSPGPLDMRMDPEGPTTAADLVNTLPEAELARILWEFGDERYSRRIARRIVEERDRAPFETTSRLADLARGLYPPRERHGRIHPATRTFQALRIAVNKELEAIEPALMAAVDRLTPGGRIVVLAYHSLEDRIVKRTFEYLSGRCRCAPELPACRCGAAARVRILTRKPVEPSAAEIQCNPRARSARLRAAEALPVQRLPAP